MNMHPAMNAAAAVDVIERVCNERALNQFDIENNYVIRMTFEYMAFISQIFKCIFLSLFVP